MCLTAFKIYMSRKGIYIYLSDLVSTFDELVEFSLSSAIVKIAVTNKTRVRTNISTITSVHKLKTRQNLACKFAIPRYNTSRLQRSAKYGGTKIWDSISSETRNSSSKVFKKKYKQCLLALY